MAKNHLYTKKYLQFFFLNSNGWDANKRKTYNQYIKKQTHKTSHTHAHTHTHTYTHISHTHTHAQTHTYNNLQNLYKPKRIDYIEKLFGHLPRVTVKG